MFWYSNVATPFAREEAEAREAQADEDKNEWQCQPRPPECIRSVIGRCFQLNNVALVLMNVAICIGELVGMSAVHV